MADTPEMIVNHKRKRKASSAFPHCLPIDIDRLAKKSKTNVYYNRRTKTASPFFPHRPPIDSNRSTEISKTAHHASGTVPVSMREASALTLENGPSPVRSLPPVGSRLVGQDEQAHTTANHWRTRSPSPSLPQHPSIDIDKSAKESQTTHHCGDNMPVSMGEGGAPTHKYGPSPAPSLPLVDFWSTGRNQPVQTGILPNPMRAVNPLKRKLEVDINLPHRPMPERKLPPAKRLNLTLPKKIHSKFPRPKSFWESVSVGWNFGAPPS